MSIRTTKSNPLKGKSVWASRMHNSDGSEKDFRVYVPCKNEKEMYAIQEYIEAQT